MSDVQKQALCWLTVALLVGAVAQLVVGQEAAVLGLTPFEVAALGLVAGAVATRRAQ